MPRFLTNKKIAIFCLLALSILLLFTKVWIISILILLAVLLYVLNKIVRESTNKMLLLSARREIKKYQYLIIGDMCPHSILKTISHSPAIPLFFFLLTEAWMPRIRFCYIQYLYWMKMELVSLLTRANNLKSLIQYLIYPI